MAKPHDGIVRLRQDFGTAYRWLREKTEFYLVSRMGTSFAARGEVATQGPHKGERVIRFFQHDREFARVYSCCWGRYYNCNRTRIGMYCEALSNAVEADT